MQQQTNTAPIILSVSQLTQAIKMQLEQGFPHIMLKGEISNLKLQTSGHLYFSLKDELSQIACVMFRQDVMTVQVPLKVGDQVVIRAKLTVFAPKGNYQLVVQEISLLGLGELLVKLEQLKQKLHALGWFDQAKKKPLPTFPKRIGVVTSPTGAVIRDIIHVLTRRLKKFHLILNPVRVQGEGAADEIAKAIEQFNHYDLVDVIIVGRGGGSVEDLMPFNDEKVASAIFKSHIPIISAVGHETDTSISDFVADVRAPTPSAAAEILSFEMDEILVTLEKYKRHIQQQVNKTIVLARQSLNRVLRHPLFSSPMPLLGSFAQTVDEMRDLTDQSMKRVLESKGQAFSLVKRNLAQHQPLRHIQENKGRLKQLERSIDTTIMRTVTDTRRRFETKGFSQKIPQLLQKELQQKKQNLSSLANHLASLNPKSLLSKGYSILFSQKDGSVINKVMNVKQGDEIRILLADGQLNAQITERHEST